MATAAKKHSSSLDTTPALKAELEYDDEPLSDYEVRRLKKAEADSATGRLLPFSAVTNYVESLRRAAKAS